MPLAVKKFSKKFERQLRKSNHEIVLINNKLRSFTTSFPDYNNNN